MTATTNGAADTAAEPGGDGEGIVVLADGVLFQEALDEAVLLDLGSGMYFTVDAVGRRMLELARQLPAFERVVEALRDEYEAGPEVLASDLEAFLGELAAESLIVRRAASPDP